MHASIPPARVGFPGSVSHSSPCPSCAGPSAARQQAERARPCRGGRSGGRRPARPGAGGARRRGRHVLHRHLLLRGRSRPLLPPSGRACQAGQGSAVLTGQPGGSALKAGARLCSALRHGCARRLLESSTNAAVASTGKAAQARGVPARARSCGLRSVGRPAVYGCAQARAARPGATCRTGAARPASCRYRPTAARCAGRTTLATTSSTRSVRRRRGPRTAPAGRAAPSHSKAPASLVRQAASPLRAGRRQHPGERARGPAVHRLCHRRHAQHLRCARRAAALTRPAFVQSACGLQVPLCVLSAPASNCPAPVQSTMIVQTSADQAELLPGSLLRVSCILIVNVIHDPPRRAVHGTRQGVTGAAPRAHPAPACVQSTSTRPGLQPARGLTQELDPRTPCAARGAPASTRRAPARQARSAGSEPDPEQPCACARPGRASIDLEDRSLPGAERAVAVAVDAWAQARGALPLACEGPVLFSPYNPRRAPHPRLLTHWHTQVPTACRAAVPA